jgi:hypothetical protein
MKIRAAAVLALLALAAPAPAQAIDPLEILITKFLDVCYEGTEEARRQGVPDFCAPIGDELLWLAPDDPL